MVSVNPMGGNEQTAKAGQSDNDKQTNNTDAKQENNCIWSKYDNSKIGEKGVIDEDEVRDFVRDNMKPIPGIKKTVDLYYSSIANLKEFVGTKWSEQSFSDMLTKLKECYLEMVKKSMEEFDGLK